MAARLNTIYGQKDYIVLYDFMSPVAVFRSIHEPVLELRTAGVTEMILTDLVPGGPQKSTTDAALINDVIATLTGSAPVRASASVKKYGLYLSGGKLIGMKYCAGLYIDGAGQVYLARDTFTDKWNRSSDAFSKWTK